MPNTLGNRTFQNQNLPNETRRRLDDLSDQVEKLSQPREVAPAAATTVRTWRKQHPGAVGGGLRKERV